MWVVVLGARQVGKSTLVQSIARGGHPAQILTLDDRATRAAALADPTGFVADLRTPVALDEVQRAPDLLLAIKQRVDEDPRPGQFLLTGSANILTAPRIADALTGRAEYLRLRPLSQGEINGTRETLIAGLFSGDVPQLTRQSIGRPAYADLITAGGYPEARGRRADRRARFFASYVDTIIQRDLTSISQVSDQANVRRLLEAIAAVSAGELNFQALSRTLGIPGSTLRNHADLLETLFLIERLPAWSTNLMRRVIKAPKAYITDTGLLAYLIGANAERLQSDLDLGGMLIETFVTNELLRQAEWESDRPRAFHYRDKDGREVDLILERRDGTIVGVESKASASVGPSDFRGLRYLRERLGQRFRAGVVMYTGASTIPFGDRLFAVPLSGIWAGER